MSIKRRTSTRQNKPRRILRGLARTRPRLFCRLCRTSPSSRTRSSNRSAPRSRAGKSRPARLFFKQGDVGNEFYMIVDGQLELVIQNENEPPSNIILSRGDYFGEKALLHDDVRAGTIKAKVMTKLLVLTAKQFEELGLRDKVNFVARAAVQAERIDLFAETDLQKFEKDEG